jgi:hypothetical protein
MAQYSTWRRKSSHRAVWVASLFDRLASGSASKRRNKAIAPYGLNGDADLVV